MVLLETADRQRELGRVPGLNCSTRWH